MNNLKESDLCKMFYSQVCQLKAYNYFKKPFELIHIPNERISSDNSSKDFMYLRALKQMGLVAGVPDYLILLGGGRFGAIEFKRDSKAKLSKNQEVFKDKLEKLEAPFLCTWKVAEAIDFIYRLLQDESLPRTLSYA